MAIDLSDVVSSVAIGNTKYFGDGPAMLLNASFVDFQIVRTQAHEQFNKHTSRLDIIAETALSASIKTINSLGITESVGIRNIDPASGQVAAKVSQTTPPITAGA